MTDLLMIREQHNHAINSINLDQLRVIAEHLVSVLRRGNKILICGCGGSAADAQHFAAELVGRFMRERRPLACIALTTDSSILTAVGNDYGFDAVFRRQVAALGRSGDALIAVSTSGRSPSILQAVVGAYAIGMTVTALTGRSGEFEGFRIAHVVHVDSESTARVQEGHEFILHCLAEMIDKEAE